MEKFYTIKDNYAEILLSKDIYPLVSIKKSISEFHGGNLYKNKQ